MRGHTRRRPDGWVSGRGCNSRRLHWLSPTSGDNLHKRHKFSCFELVSFILMSHAVMVAYEIFRKTSQAWSIDEYGWNVELWIQLLLNNLMRSYERQTKLLYNLLAQSSVDIRSRMRRILTGDKKPSLKVID
ncbi:hypothetical protein FGO68_gene13091 [Halteria grandinella]|uniref:Uncharacterized protein n=1 Tax=Halteria grandinella TaxID=5974 RepID=A0A8J8SV69_HALGN|nr:hypothetical protein FGO68_gene13091 [Halteria grandinella]